MRWLIFSYEQDSIVKQCDDMLHVVGQTVIHEHHHGKSSIEDVKAKIAQHQPNRIIVIANDEKSEQDHSLLTTLNDHLLIPLYVGQATINTYSPIPVLLLTFTTRNEPSDSLSPTDIVQNATDELINIYPHIIKYVKQFLFFLSKADFCSLVQNFSHQSRTKT